MSRISRLVIAYFVAVPLALTLGFLVATPGLTSLATLGFVLFCLSIPLVIQWHHVLVILSWNSAFMLGFMPGQPLLWLIMAALSFGIAVINNVLGLKTSLRAPELTKPILFLLGVILVTAWFRGGVGSKILGSSGYGGKNYTYVLGAFMGYFALTAQRIPLGKSQRTVKWFFLSAITSILSNLIYILGPSFYFLYNLVSVNAAITQAQSDLGQNVVNRLGGLGPAASGLLCFILARWGIRGIFEWKKPWRLMLLIAVVAGALFSGFRSQIAFVVVLFFIEFMIEGLWKTLYLPLFGLLGLFCLLTMLLFANKMPPAVQRSLAFLPLDINPDIRDEAAGSSEWRFQMWREVLPEVPHYLLLGKGYYIDPLELHLTEEAVKSGLLNGFEVSILAGDYHSGPLSVLIPFGIFGALAFAWLLGTGIKVLLCNYRYGDARLKQANSVLLSFFVAQCLFFVFVFGAMNAQLMVFLGTLGFSVSLNGGVCRKEVPKAVPAPAASNLLLEPA